MIVPLISDILAQFTLTIIPQSPCISRIPRHSSAHLCNPAGGYISWEMTPTTDTSLFLTTYRDGSHLPADINIEY
ncbi:hypothetical protein DWZ43_11845 [Ruminococcus sp. AF32-2AC]|nr:hypothetical protein DWZ43_11845 [Ruminococcus sp. AF32-2AC]